MTQWEKYQHRPPAGNRPKGRGNDTKADLQQHDVLSAHQCEQVENFTRFFQGNTPCCVLPLATYVHAKADMGGSHRRWHESLFALILVHKPDSMRKQKPRHLCTSRHFHSYCVFPLRPHVASSGWKIPRKGLLARQCVHACLLLIVQYPRKVDETIFLTRVEMRLHRHACVKMFITSVHA